MTNNYLNWQRFGTNLSHYPTITDAHKVQLITVAAMPNE
ncbi:hypothetical protein X805_17810 [Sphaerotilus natans subsp. natans DSM 6575]|uniref:Uncharacterized protein n=1 Tax=Sphaerotilus natans subsp. natans DSM 6575 TaxID=1286631 RepID=A0A059KM99_9BURK|nr:hypothetical protein X805_17810 [Sphaerotilus natans subsp. natans DSM 6575]